MAKRRGCACVLVVLAVSLCRYVEGQQVPSSATIQRSQREPRVAMLAARPTVECAAEPASIVAGQTGVVRARGMSPGGRALRYSFAADAGEVVSKGDYAELHTAGLGARVVHVTCMVMDDLGNSASKGVDVIVLGRQAAVEEGTAAEKTYEHGKGTVPPVTKVESGHSASPAPPPPPPVILVPVQDSIGVESGLISLPKKTKSPAEEAGQAGDGYQQGKAFELWKNGLRTGKIEYQVPARMLMQHASTVTVVIHGYGDTGTVSLPGATGSGSLKQSERMKVEVLAPDHPDNFTIVPQGGESVRFVPIDGATTWMWSVTPSAPGEKQRLLVRASVIYPGTDDRTNQQLPDYSAVVEVDVPSTWALIVENYRKDPLKWFSYVIPGGAGFTFLVGIIVWWGKKKKKEQSK